MRIWLLTLIFTLLLLSACQEALPLVDESISVKETAVVIVTEIPPSATAQPTTTMVATATTTSIPTIQAAQATATATLRPQEESARELDTAVAPTRDNYRLAQAYRGLNATQEKTVLPVTEPLPIGTIHTFNILNVIDNTVSQIDAELLAIGEHAYFWFDTTPGALIPDANELDAAVATFDDIYGKVTAQFGSEANPGIDGDPRLHVVNASPIALCGTTLDTMDQCYLAGLVTSIDMLPRAVDGRSNEREMFVMNSQRFGGDYYLGVLAHEFRHMIEDNFDSSGMDWEKEGSATLAAEIAGFPSNGPERGNVFLTNPDQQLNSWTEDNTSPFYGQGYLLNRYILDRFGADFYKAFATSQAQGLNTIDAIAPEFGLDQTGETVWLDWLTALALHNHPHAPEQYTFQNAGVDTAAATPIETLPTTIDTTVHQYAADYYALPNEPLTLTFSGNETVSLIGSPAASGDHYWVAQRANHSNPQLTRELDLSAVDSATLNYSVFADIEHGYDFAYVAVSTDNGRSWQPLSADNMQGLDPADSPSGGAHTPRFYTGRSQEWVQESIDLTPFAGQTIQLRFEYVTDPILTYAGIAFDDISVPEINFFDDAESELDGWTAEGFVRSTDMLPQNWHLILITFEADSTPTVQQFTPNSGEPFTLNVENPGSENPILIVAATAPQTLEETTYSLNLAN
ncbi:MAG: immune inhibitor A [Anaerolineales bacterium]|nr:immune inhibitor A [Anaerolineales bacterium]